MNVDLVDCQYLSWESEGKTSLQIILIAKSLEHTEKKIIQFPPTGNTIYNFYGVENWK